MWQVQLLTSVSGEQSVSQKVVHVVTVIFERVLGLCLYDLRKTNIGCRISNVTCFSSLQQCENISRSLKRYFHMPIPTRSGCLGVLWADCAMVSANIPTNITASVCPIVNHREGTKDHTETNTSASAPYQVAIVLNGFPLMGPVILHSSSCQQSCRRPSPTLSHGPALPLIRTLHPLWHLFTRTG